MIGAFARTGFACRPKFFGQHFLKQASRDWAPSCLQTVAKMADQRKITTVLLDLDGTLVDTETLVNGVACQVVEGYGKTLTHEVQQAALGKRPLEAWKTVAELLDIPKSAQELFNESEPLLVNRWKDCNLLPGAERLVTHLLDSNIKLGIVTSSTRTTFDRKFAARKDLADKFHVIVTGDLVEEGKPHPEGYLQAAKALGSHPEECLVVEDAPVGFQAGVAAGMKVVAVPSLTGLPEAMTKDCTLVLASLLDFRPQAFGLPPFMDTVHDVVPVAPAWTIAGPVVKGFGRGSATLGIPTANLPPESLMTSLPGAVSGIYCGFASVGDSPEVHRMVMSIGWNPYFNNKERTAEPWLLSEFSEPFYGKELRLVVCGYIRPECNFTTLEALIARIHEDAAVTKVALAASEFARYSASEFLKPSPAVSAQ